MSGPVKGSNIQPMSTGVRPGTGWHLRRSRPHSCSRHFFPKDLSRSRFLLATSRPPSATLGVMTDEQLKDARERVADNPEALRSGARAKLDIPLSRAMIRCLVRVMRLGRVLYPTQAQEWLFPADSDSGHLVEHKENRATLSKWGNDLRQTYRERPQGFHVLQAIERLQGPKWFDGPQTSYHFCLRQLANIFSVDGVALPRNRADRHAGHEPARCLAGHKKVGPRGRSAPSRPPARRRPATIRRSRFGPPANCR
jgi:hypothetical protein